MADRAAVEGLRDLTDAYLSRLAALLAELDAAGADAGLRDELATALLEREMGTPAAIARVAGELLAQAEAAPPAPTA